MLVRQVVYTTNDTNGNSRAMVMVYQIGGEGAKLVYAAKGTQGETVGGASFKRKTIHLPSIQVAPKEFKRLIAYAQSWNVFVEL